MDRKHVVFSKITPMELNQEKMQLISNRNIEPTPHEKLLKDVGAQIVFKDHHESIYFILSE